ncbi:uncharacterized protein G2W53_011988 [Senna tora]|uniref:Uncharacterized protein n=1 Tax=Senna tora TaxID=362788 RepID=A0A834WN69_9FABA|nr:uncharacterized protein G2W53_011988 [Senna tora]
MDPQAKHLGQRNMAIVASDSSQ